MRKLIIGIILLCAIASGCAKQDSTASVSTDNGNLASQDGSLSSSEQDKPSPTQVALLYADPELGMFLRVNSPDWTYTKQLYEGEVYFYLKDENPTTSVNGFAISSQEKGASTIEETWEYAKSSFETSIPGFEWNEEEPIEVGEYTGQRYHLSGTGMVGDYIIWETDKSQYICSFTSDPNNYEEYYNLLAESLLSFNALE